LFLDLSKRTLESGELVRAFNLAGHFKVIINVQLYETLSISITFTHTIPAYYFTNTIIIVFPTFELRSSIIIRSFLFGSLSCFHLVFGHMPALFAYRNLHNRFQSRRKWECTLVDIVFVMMGVVFNLMNIILPLIV